jgi:hypothetical protein
MEHNLVISTQHSAILMQTITRRKKDKPRSQLKRQERRYSTNDNMISRGS